MDIQSVLVESKYFAEVYGNSGIMYNNEYVVTTFNAIAPFFTNLDPEKIEPETLKLLLSDPKSLKDIKILIYSKDDKSNIITSFTAHFENLFQSSDVKASNEVIFRNWSFNFVNNNKCNFDLLSLILVLRIDCAGNGNTFREDVQGWLSTMPQTIISKGQNLKCVACAFGTKEFLNHYSQGIVSNILGRNNCLIFSDMPLTPGGEGSPVFTHNENSRDIPIGIVISCINWCKGETLNFTVIADLRSIFSEILQTSYCGPKLKIVDSNIPLLNTIESSLFQIYNGSIWGTAIVIDREKGILLTNAHVVESSKKLMIHQKGRAISCDIIFSCPADRPIDLAVLKTREPIEKLCRAIYFSDAVVRCGDTVYAAGFPIFSKETNADATVTKGHVSLVHKYMIKTSCCIYPGASGGAILNEMGKLVAVIVSNTTISDPIIMSYPRLNMNIPAKLLEPILTEYLINEDIAVLQRLSTIDAEIWNNSSKL